MKPTRAARTRFPIDRVLRSIARENRRWTPPSVTRVSWDRDPYWVLVSTVLSLRTRDAVTDAATERLRALAPDVRALAARAPREVARAIYPVCFYRTKSRALVELARRLVAERGGAVPDTLEELLALKGVGLKTANLVLSHGFGKAAICVDTHVHRLCNRLGYLRTRSPEETERALREVLPRRHWRTINDRLVTFGQNLCTPLSPWCSRCPVRGDCARVGVTRSR